MANLSWKLLAVSLLMGLAACDSGEEAPPAEVSSVEEESVGESAEREVVPTSPTASTDTDALDEAPVGEDEMAEIDASVELPDVDEAEPVAPSPGEEAADQTWDSTEDDVAEALKETERRFKEAEQELEEQFQAAEETDVKKGQEIEIPQPQQ